MATVMNSGIGESVLRKEDAPLITGQGRYVDDITPEMYLYTVLQDYMLYDDMKAVVQTMQGKQPNSQEVKELAAWVNSKQN